jgi:cysteine-rich repeat protein
VDDAVVDLIRCGDGVLQTGEECDDGNTAFGDGCTPFCRNEVPITAICNHPCPSKLTFNGPDVVCEDAQDPNRARLDKFYTKIGFFPSTPLFNPATDGIGVELRNSRGVIYSLTMQPGALVKEGRSYRYRDPFGATGQGGVRFMGMNLRNDGLWRLEIKAYGDLQCLADEAEMTLIVLAGNDVFTKTATWRELGRGGGWIANFKQL